MDKVMNPAPPTGKSTITISESSPTYHHNQFFLNMSTQAPATTTPSLHPLPLTLIVAATSSSLAIGRSGGLPWRIKADMAFFARITKRVPLTALPSTPTLSPTPIHNAVIMGHKTYLSIPPKFRPLPDRINVVLSRNPDSISAPDNVLRASGIEEAVKMLQERGDVAKVWVIGGGEVYKAALEWEGAKEIVLTRVENEVEGCDTFFPVRLGEEGEWKRVPHEEFEEVVEEQIPRGVQEEGEWKFEFQLWRK
ncbi:hypothetical protein EX30DRAFT_337161 [Ascodesmis nigricans]|uniref:Dihydrofolate reductase n=1 Tax=Ascodesmis nigricans TaxID=341454 RepID=A0A4V3SJN2_9PEZI|nr:hypothetical protein EX30DRAFT_337161 [Ascodesmis nigricans]